MAMCVSVAWLSCCRRKLIWRTLSHVQIFIQGLLGFTPAVAVYAAPHQLKANSTGLHACSSPKCAHADVRFRVVALVLLAEINLCEGVI